MNITHNLYLPNATNNAMELNIADMRRIAAAPFMINIQHTRYSTAKEFIFMYN